MKVGIAGLGLIGGSFAKSYKERSDSEVLGFDGDASILKFSKLYGAVDRELTLDNVNECDLILVALYPEIAVQYLKDIAPFVNKNAIVMDLCGTKRDLCQAGFALAKEFGFTFIGSHPMAGTQFSGFKSSSSQLFVDQPMVLVPENSEDILLVDKVIKMLQPVGFGHYAVTTPSEHDEIIAFTSQMPHIISNAFIKSPTAIRHKGFSAGSYKDLTRVAWLNAPMWTDLFIQNRDMLVNELDILINSLSEYKTALMENDSDRLCDLLKAGKERKEQVDGK